MAVKISETRMRAIRDAAHMHDDRCGHPALRCGRNETPMLVDLLAELDARPPMVEYGRDPAQMMTIATEWPAATYGSISLHIDTGEIFRGWAEPDVVSFDIDPDPLVAARPSVLLRAIGESSWMTPDDALALAAMLIAAARGQNAFDPGNGE